MRSGPGGILSFQAQNAATNANVGIAHFEHGRHAVKISKVINNNVVLAHDGDSPVILTGRGIGFQRNVGDDVDATKIVQTFYPATREEYENLRDFLADIAPEYISLAKRITHMAETEWNTTFDQSSIVALADHLAFAVKRAQSGQVMPHPLHTEVSHLFHREYAMGKRAISVVRENNMMIDDNEAVAITLHFINALAFSGSDLSRTFAMTAVFSQIFDVLESAYNRPFATDSVSAARFITHLRYFFARAHAGKQLAEHPAAFNDSVRDSFPKAYQAAQKVRSLLELHLGTSLTNDEQTYLTLHIARLSTGD